MLIICPTTFCRIQESWINTISSKEFTGKTSTTLIWADSLLVQSNKWSIHGSNLVFSRLLWLQTVLLVRIFLFLPIQLLTYYFIMLWANFSREGKDIGGTFKVVMESSLKF